MCIRDSANCDNDAFYEYKITSSKSVFYCGKDLPGFLEPRRKAGLLGITAKMKEELASAHKALETTAAPAAEPETPVVEETPVEVVEEVSTEEPVVEEETAEEPKKAVKKQAK